MFAGSFVTGLTMPDWLYDSMTWVGRWELQQPATRARVAVAYLRQCYPEG